MNTAVARSFRVSAALALAGWLAMPWNASASVSFTGLGFLPGEPYSEGFDVSGDGTVVVGVSKSGGLDRAFRWTTSGGIEDLGTLTGMGVSYGYGVSGNGLVIVGYSDAVNSRAFRWTSGTGMVSLGRLPGGLNSYAHAVSVDGSVVVGYSDASGGNYNAFRWTSGGGMVSLGTLPGGPNSFGLDVSADGSVIVGMSESSGGLRAFRWTNGTGMVSLGALPGATNSEGISVSADGSVVVGTFYGSDHLAFRWTSCDGMASLGTLPGGMNSIGYAVNGDGLVIVGRSSSTSGSRAFLWTAADGMVDLNTYLPTLGIDLSGWLLRDARGISADGLNIVGSGIHDGIHEAWVATIPEPSTVTVIAAASRKACDLNLNLCAPATTEPRQGGVSELRISFSTPLGGPGSHPVTIEERLCPPTGSYGPYGGDAEISASVAGNELVLTFAPALENARTYRINIGPEVTPVPGQFVEVRALLGDVNSDGRVNAGDRSVVVGYWTGPGFSCATDITVDGITNAADRSAIVGAWTGTQNCAP